MNILVLMIFMLARLKLGGGGNYACRPCFREVNLSRRLVHHTIKKVLTNLRNKPYKENVFTIDLSDEKHYENLRDLL